MTNTLRSAINANGELVFLVEMEVREFGCRSTTLLGPDLERLTTTQDGLRGEISGRKYRLLMNC